MQRLGKNLSGSKANRELRLAVETDIPALEQLIPLSVRALQAAHYSPAQMEAALGPVFGVDRQLILDGTYFVAEEQGQIVGCGGWSRRKAMFGGDRDRAGEDGLLDPKSDPARIRAFFIHPNWARRGIGRSILVACEAAIRQARFQKIELVATLTGEPLYAANGYSVVECYEVPMSDGLALPVVKMAKTFMQRLGKNDGGYFGEQIVIRDILREMKLAAQERGWSSEIFHSEEGFYLYALTRPPSRTTIHAPRIYISTGIHGDEPAGPLAALRLMKENKWPDNAEIVLLPCLNPVGFVKNQRENGQHIDLNRDYLQPQSPEIRAHIEWLENQSPFDLCLCLHEDWESHGFYVYELNPDHKPSLAEAMVEAVTEVCPVDQSEIIEGREARGGIISPNLDPRTRPLWPESFWLLQNKTRLSYTLEAPSDFELDVRVNALVAATQAALMPATSD